jgi:hypothetical protein
MIFPLSLRERGNEGERLIKLNQILRMPAMGPEGKNEEELNNLWKIK